MEKMELSTMYGKTNQSSVLMGRMQKAMRANVLPSTDITGINTTVPSYTSFNALLDEGPSESELKWVVDLMFSMRDVLKSIYDDDEVEDMMSELNEVSLIIGAMVAQAYYQGADLVQDYMECRGDWTDEALRTVKVTDSGILIQGTKYDGGVCFVGTLARKYDDTEKATKAARRKYGDNTINITAIRPYSRTYTIPVVRLSRIAVDVSAE